jgi:hypothetical protein
MLLNHLSMEDLEMLYTIWSYVSQYVSLVTVVKGAGFRRLCELQIVKIRRV